MNPRCGEILLPAFFLSDFYRAKKFLNATNLDMRVEIGAECEWKLFDEL